MKKKSRKFTKLAKRPVSKKKPTRKREDFSQAAVRIVRKATRD